MQQRRDRRRTVFALLVACLIAAPAAAVTTSAAFEDGKLAYRQGDYALALRHFEAARDTGAAGPAVHYNIAVTQYRLHRYADARSTFEFIDREFPQMRPLTRYNLGLVALKEGRDEDARRRFKQAHDLSADNEKLRRLSANMLRKMPPAEKEKSHWHGMLSTRVGHDSNVALRDELGLPTGVTGESPLLELWGTVRGPLSNKNGFRLDAGAYLVRYLDFEALDQTVLRLGGLYDWRRSDWFAQIGAHAGRSTINGEGFENTASAGMSLGRYLTEASSFSLHYRYDDVSAAESVFSGIDGSRQRLDIRYRWYDDDRSFGIAYRNEANDRNDPGVSPSRNRVTAHFDYLPDAGWGYEILADYRISKYDDLLPVREENLATLIFAVSRIVVQDWRLFVQAEIAENDSNVPEFSYDRQQLTIGIRKHF